MHWLPWTTWTPTWTTYIRVSGLVAWYLLNLEVAVGVMTAGGVAKHFGAPRRRVKSHKMVSWFFVLAVATHVGAIVWSHYHGWGVDMVTGMGWGTVARNAGVFAMYLLLVIMLVASLKRFIPPRLWTFQHRALPLLLLVSATTHGLGAGTDSRDPQIIYPAIVTLTILLSIFSARKYAAHAQAIKARGRRKVQRRQYRYGRPEGFHYRRRK